MGDGWVGFAANWMCIGWTLFVCVIFSFPTVVPVTADNMNYASVITVGVMVLAGLWYLVEGHRRYQGPQSNLAKHGFQAGQGGQGQEERQDGSEVDEDVIKTKDSNV